MLGYRKYLQIPFLSSYSDTIPIGGGVLELGELKMF